MEERTRERLCPPVAFVQGGSGARGAAPVRRRVCTRAKVAFRLCASAGTVPRNSSYYRRRYCQCCARRVLRSVFLGLFGGEPRGEER